MRAAVDGTVDPAFAGVRDAFAANFEAGLELGAIACAVSVDGRNVVDLWGGHLDVARTRPWERDSLVCVFSCTKGVVAIATMWAVDRGLVDLDRPVAAYWPEFAAEGKADAAGALAAHPRGRAARDRHPDAVRLAQRLGRHDHGARRPGAVVGAGLGARLPRRDLRPPGRRGAAPGHGAHRRADRARRAGRSTRRGSPHAAAAGRRRTDRGPGGGDVAGGHVLRPVGPGDVARTPVVRQPARLQRPEPLHDPDVPPGRDPGRQPARQRPRRSTASTPCWPAAARCPGCGWHHPIWWRSSAARTCAATTWSWSCPPRSDSASSTRSRSGPSGPGARTYGHNGSGGSLGIVDPDAGVSLGYAMNRLWWGPTRSDPRWAGIFDGGLRRALRRAISAGRRGPRRR